MSIDKINGDMVNDDSVSFETAEQDTITQTKKTVTLEKGIISFSPNSGRGTGKVSLKLEHFDEVRKYLEQTYERLLDKPVEVKELTELDEMKAIIDRTAKIVDGKFSFQLESKRGAKPARIPESQVQDFFGVLDLVSQKVSGLKQE